MELNFDPQCQKIIDRAKKGLPHGYKLDLGLVIRALYQGTELKKQFPELAEAWKIEVCRENANYRTDPADDLWTVLAPLCQHSESIFLKKLALAIVQSQAGSALLHERLSGADFDRFCRVIHTLPTPPQPPWRTSPERAAALEDLRPYGRMLTDLRLPEPGVAEMEKPLRAVLRQWAVRGRRNVLVLGQPGTGKTALVRELARRVREGHESIPRHLRELDLFELSPAFLKAGAFHAGEYEQRIKQLLQVLEAHPQIILFVDEIHSLLRSSMHSPGVFAEGNEAFKAALGHEGIAVIGCTTSAEYRHYIAPDEALARRFATIRLQPPSPEATLRILEARLPQVAVHYPALEIPPTILPRLIELTDDLLPSRYQPDKSIQLLDEACAYCVTELPPLPRVDEQALLKALEDQLGHSLVQLGVFSEQEVFDRLRERIQGQDEVLRGIAAAFVAGLSQGRWGRTSGPRGVLLFAGPTGVGKTETALCLAQLLGGDQHRLVRIDCNTLQGSGEASGPIINRLLGVPPGYIGYSRGQGGILSKVRDFPECVVLFDEFEKASASLGEVLLRIIDEGQAMDSEGGMIDFRHAFVIFTTNAGCRYEQGPRIGFDAIGQEVPEVPTVDLAGVQAALLDHGLGPEFLGRIGHQFLFQGLSAEVAWAIIDRQLTQMQQHLARQNLVFDWAPTLAEHLVVSWQPRYGARYLNTILRNRIVEHLNIAEVRGEMQGVSRVRLELSAPPGTTGLAGMSARRRQGAELTIALA